MDNVKVLNMNLADFEQIEPIYNSCFDTFWSPQNLKSELENENYQSIVAKIDNKIVGFASIWFSVDDAHITNIAVHKDFRNQGIACKILEQIINIAKEHNKTSLTLEVNIKNTIAQKLYLKYGFKNLGIRKNYYSGIEDAFIMTLYFNN